jgi:uncharacterized membrane protein
MVRVIPALRTAGLRARQTNILWASWPLLTAFGWGIAAVLYKLSFAAPSDLIPCIATIMAVTTLAGGVLVLVGTKRRHPGWVVLSAIAGLIWVGQAA